MKGGYQTPFVPGIPEDELEDIEESVVQAAVEERYDTVTVEPRNDHPFRYEHDRTAPGTYQLAQAPDDVDADLVVDKYIGIDTIGMDPQNGDVMLDTGYEETYYNVLTQFGGRLFAMDESECIWRYDQETDEIAFLAPNEDDIRHVDHPETAARMELISDVLGHTWQVYREMQRPDDVTVEGTTPAFRAMIDKIVPQIADGAEFPCTANQHIAQRRGPAIARDFPTAVRRHREYIRDEYEIDPDGLTVIDDFGNEPVITYEDA